MSPIAEQPPTWHELQEARKALHEANRGRTVNHLSLIQWLAIGYAAFGIVCAFHFWPWGR